VPTPCDTTVTDPHLATLSRREREVAELIAAGLSNKQIADRLFIARSTVKDHVHHILQKTALPNRTAVAAAWRAPVPIA
jgi:non-specific serine/threonine protein kinase